MKENPLMLFQLRLAERLGITYRDLMTRLYDDELALWIAKDRIEPRHDPYLTTAVLIRHLYALHGAKKIPEAHKIFPHLKPPEPDPRVQAARMRVWAIQHNAMEARKSATPP